LREDEVIPVVFALHITGNNTIKTNPDLVRRFVKATKRAWEEAKKNPDAAVDVAMKVKPDLNRQSTKDQMLVDFELLDSMNVKGQIGFGHEKDWTQTIDLLKKYRGLETQQTWTAFHTHEFLPK
jgi:NitT/TauT family transport system substrate-binding protein